MKLLKQYFPELSGPQLDQFQQLQEALIFWNERINVISRKDTDHLEERHILHSLAIAKYVQFTPGTRILDVGTGGGFPGLPLAIMFPDSHFTLVDSIAKKIKVVHALGEACNLKNVHAFQARAETIRKKYEFVVSRAVTAFPTFYSWTRKSIAPVSRNRINNGILYLKGGDLAEELAGFQSRVQITPLSSWFVEDWFREKKIVYLKMA